jgi:hypothetical protein
MQEDKTGGQSNSTSGASAPISPASTPQPTVVPPQAVTQPAIASTVAALPNSTPPQTTETKPDASKEPSLFVASDDPEVEHAPPIQIDQEPPYSWEASEFIHHQKSFGWFALLFIAAVIIVGLVYFLTKDLISCVVIALGSIVIGFYAAVAPKQVTYEISSQGVRIGAKVYRYDYFKAFSIVKEGAFSNIIFLPQKRFAAITSIYYDPSDEALIVNRLSESLPMDDYRHDALDRFMYRIRF